jgi:hypothetical protein
MNDDEPKLSGTFTAPTQIEVTHTLELGTFESVFVAAIVLACICAPLVRAYVEGLMQ